MPPEFRPDWQGFQGEAIDQSMRKRLEYRQDEKFIIDKIFPAGAMHLLGGPSGSGKTTWLMQLMFEWEQEQLIFGKYQSHPCPWVYITCDRTLRETDRTLRRLGYGNWFIECHSLASILPKSGGKITESPDFCKHILQKFKHAHLFVIEGLQALMPDVSRGRSQNKQELLWALEQSLILEPENKTVIATTHNPKIAQQGVQDDRSKFLGSQGFIGSCGTMIGFEKDEKIENQRRVKVMGRNFPDMKLIYSLDENGKFVLEGSQDERGKETYETDDDREIQVLTHAGVMVEFTAREMQMATLLSKTHVYRILTKLVEQGALTARQDGQKIVYTYKPAKQ